MISLGMVVLLLALLWLWWRRRCSERRLNQLIGLERGGEPMAVARMVIDASRFDASLKTRLRLHWQALLKLMAPKPGAKLLLFAGVATGGLVALNEMLLHQSLMLVLGWGYPLAFVVFVLQLKRRREARFQDDFPDALNILSGALSAGQSVVHAFEYVGEQLDNEVGREFKLMSERLLIGEDPDDVLRRSGASFPYVEYFFFVSTIRLNLSRGGQLKEVINRINRLMFDARSLDKKKSALTSEARASAKIVAALPLIFLLILKYTSPENYHFVMFEEGGKPIFYYVLISELIGFACIAWILRGVE
ncbi:type II secretion system F family protein [Ferrimonas sp. SCSIO 43195]|uniref:type II secretion system F family protein n=1 Tax=Ferrimonas sp. SCSIO 43195 TaxID=2822844 RepID=UPI0020765833|nr:type II secretion system F family protein [Ferrimonas sp. SCSIO 43195]USD38917.1 type II secretion system F family protein [Ferrimonas sp. SCSIO 43195]